MNQSEFVAIACNLLKAREKSGMRIQDDIGFDFASHCLKNWRESLKPITKPSNGNLVITLYSHLKTLFLQFADYTVMTTHFKNHSVLFHRSNKCISLILDSN